MNNQFANICYKALIEAYRTAAPVSGVVKVSTEVAEITADIIERLAADRTELRNELCYRCGQYHEAHNGACDGCKWRDG